MADASPCRKKKKLTLATSEKGVETAERALLRLGFESKSNFAESQRLSRSTVTKFFKQDPIQLDSFKKICDALKLKWQEIAGITPESADRDLIESQVSLSSDVIEEGATVTTLIRQVTILEKTSQTIKTVITLKGEIDSISNIQIIAAILKEHGGDTIQIADIQEGSIKLFVEGSLEDIDRLLIKINSGELTEIDGFPVEDVQILSESVEDEENSEQKWRLVEEIVTNPRGRDLSGADLSDTDLRKACLIYANLNDVDLSDADLSDADLSRANLGGANLSGANLIRANAFFANLSGANLRGANLSFVHLSFANLSFANLSGANLRGAKLRLTNLGDANLSDANLSFANLSLADLSCADLIDIQVEQTRFRNNLGITEKLKQDLIKRGAIFEDSPGDPSRIPIRA